MPVLKHAKKKLRQDKVRTLRNKKQKEQYKDFIKAAKKNVSAEAVSSAFQSIDKAAKNNILHKNKAARLKSSLSKLLAGGKTVAPDKPAKKVTKLAKKKAVAKKASAKKTTSKK